jgi:hypothetical protein
LALFGGRESTGIMLQQKALKDKKKQLRIGKLNNMGSTEEYKQKISLQQCILVK